MKRYSWVFVLVVACVFGLTSLILRNDYGWNWDQSQHFIRGQAYFRYLTGGRTESDAVRPYQGRQSIYEKNPFEITWLTKVIGHPPTTDIILAAVNQLFYKRLGLLGDTESYHAYGIVLTFITALIVGIWSFQISGLIAGMISVIAFYGLPLLWAEQHFNFKDPAILAYNTIFLYLFWLGVTKKKWLLLMLASIIGGISLGTKLNIIFLAPAVCLWLWWYTRGKFRTVHLLYISIPVVMTAVLYLTYPFLWTQFIPHVKSLIDYYRQVGGSRCPYVPMTGLWFWNCLDLQTARLFLVTIPVPTLVLSGIGSIVALISVGKHKLAPYLWLLVLIGILLRVILPINSLYGGSLRQVLEFIGPMSLLAGLGAGWLMRRFHRMITAILLFIVYVPVFVSMWKLHPNENLYSNIVQHIIWPMDTSQFVNGIVSYGNAYKQGIDWINDTVPQNAKVSLVTGLDSAVPASVFRPDIQYGLRFWSGYEMKGEYLIELVDTQSHQTQLFPYKYANTTLEPVYERNIEGFPIVRVWKNDAAHKKVGYRYVSEATILRTTVSADEALIQLPETKKLREVSIGATGACRQAIVNAYFLVSPDGITYRRTYETVEEMNRLNTTQIIYPFAGDSAKYIKLFTYAPGDCDLSGVQFTVTVFR